MGDADVRVRSTKWGGGAHWTLVGYRLGEDEHGVWVAAPIGTEMSKPGGRLTAERHHVMLFPHRLPCTAAFYEPWLSLTAPLLGPCQSGTAKSAPRLAGGSLWTGPQPMCG